MVCLPALVLGAEVKGSRVLEVRREDDSLIAGFAGQLDAQVPGVEGDESKLVVLGCDVLLGKGTKSLDGVAEGAGVSDLVPGEGGQARCGSIVSGRSVKVKWRAWGVGSWDGKANVLQRAVMGVLTGLTSTLSRWSWGSRSANALAVAIGRWKPHFLAGFCIEQNPAELNDFGRVFCDIYTVLVTGGGYVNDHIAVEVRRLR